MCSLVHGNDILYGCIILDGMCGGKMISSASHHNIQGFFADVCYILTGPISKGAGGGDTSSEIKPASKMFL